MSAPLRVALTDLEDLTLFELREATTVSQRTRDTLGKPLYETLRER